MFLQHKKQLGRRIWDIARILEHLIADTGQKSYSSQDDEQISNNSAVWFSNEDSSSVITNVNEYITPGFTFYRLIYYSGFYEYSIHTESERVN